MAAANRDATPSIRNFGSLIICFRCGPLAVLLHGPSDAAEGGRRAVVRCDELQQPVNEMAARPRLLSLTAPRDRQGITPDQQATGKSQRRRVDAFECAPKESGGGGLVWSTQLLGVGEEKEEGPEMLTGRSDDALVEHPVGCEGGPDVEMLGGEQRQRAAEDLSSGGALQNAAAVPNAAVEEVKGGCGAVHQRV